MTAPIALVAREGEYVSCEQGHRLYRITQHILPGEDMRPSQFDPVAADIPRPVPAVRVAHCPRCDAPYFRPKVKGWQVNGFEIHFEQDGWR